MWHQELPSGGNMKVSCWLNTLKLDELGSSSRIMTTTLKLIVCPVCPQKICQPLIFKGEYACYYLVTWSSFLPVKPSCSGLLQLLPRMAIDHARDHLILDPTLKKHHPVRWLRPVGIGKQWKERLDSIWFFCIRILLIDFLNHSLPPPRHIQKKHCSCPVNGNMPGVRSPMLRKRRPKWHQWVEGGWWLASASQKPARFHAFDSHILIFCVNSNKCKQGLHLEPALTWIACKLYKCMGRVTSFGTASMKMMMNLLAFTSIRKPRKDFRLAGGFGVIHWAVEGPPCSPKSRTISGLSWWQVQLNIGLKQHAKEHQSEFQNSWLPYNYVHIMMYHDASCTQPRPL